MTFRAAAPACPACGALLEGTTLFDVRVERCPACAGAWLDAVQPARSDATDVPATAAPTAGPRCPRCERALSVSKIGPADTLACARCGGAFVARDSFGLVLDAATSVGTMPPPAPEHARVLAVLRARSRS